MKSRKLALAAVFAALICLSTAFLRLPTGAGYIHIGDACVLIACRYLTFPYALSSVIIGCCLADICGYAMYLPATLLIKSLTVILVCRRTAGRRKTILRAVCAESVMTGGYFIYEALCLGYGFGAAANVLPNILQGALGVILSTAISELLPK